MGTYITTSDVNAWFAPTKLTLLDADFNENREQQIADWLFSQFKDYAPIDTWTDEDDTPPLIRSILAMYYAAWTYDMTYSDDDEENRFSGRLRRAADLAVQGILSGEMDIVGVDVPTNNGPSFFPTDLSSANPATPELPNDGGPYFMMGSVW
jgi:hypothetical protein